MTTLLTLPTDQREAFNMFLRARPFTEKERAYWQLCWLEVTQTQLNSLNDLLPENTRITARALDSRLYINADVISDAIDSGRLAAIYDIVSNLNWRYVNPWDWEQEELTAWQVYDGTTATIYQVGNVVLHSDKTWVSTTPNNVWEPGVFGWQEKAVGTIPPAWRQPLGAGDAWGLNDEVMHANKKWRSNVPANVWEPGATGITQWDDITETEPPSDTSEWAVGVSYAVDDEVTYQGTTYRCIQAHTSITGWHPPAVPALWSAI